ncbi:hypothetical protein, variant 2 [Aphanomyces invadans]|uniref:Metallo-beta-lactamase domain-containing protein n=1 Tax=Aphanomyces invadans TaxID=157072 RepID=A0A024UBA3_9STRA|nr:hypothetical protein H310_05084 [Aphanomyces invadans]XP_008867929.1 hypothetical protein, variant 1 [Aphanomyces invadans]XP_008867930.1 hypothetical protein, variant 2 [Aphanomyces invadans]ETW03699.1 hypothetical protein H310_05084 [Aphanomyces invadans]ETW03700.1 hypothetical protein, variant 1 [Aphanomyces invadans]ETW03701.1 hypothetical protein, variant 2 [Aphanomyces invadans]|eukprot:XP_008867928.1 hypothetical protein H310_05084 [Aphanomyces invadans]
MKLIQLGHADEGVSSFLLGTCGRQVLLDCGLNLRALVHLPLHGPFRFHGPSLHFIDAQTIDYVVISNHMSLLGLPLLTERTAFQGEIFATEPCVQFGRRMLLDMLDMVEKRQRSSNGSRPWMSRAHIKTLPHADQQLLLDMEYDQWADPYTRHEIDRCLQRITIIPYRQTLTLSYELKLTAVSSGFALGASCWIIESPMEKLVYIPAASSEMNRHPTALDVNFLRDADIMLVTDLKDDRDTRMIDKRLETFLNHLLTVHSRHGTSLVPCHFDGVLFDLLENLQLFLAAINHAPIPIYFVTSTPVDSNLCGPQWLCNSKAQKVFAGTSPFVHSQLIDECHLRLVAPGSPVPLEEPCIIFANHPSLRLGDAVELIPKLQLNPSNAVVFIDPHVQPFQAIAPFQPNFLMEWIHAPIDFRLSCNNANILIAECKPQTVVLPACYVTAQGDGQCVRLLKDLVVTRDADSTVLLHHLEPAMVTKVKKVVDAVLDPELAAQTNLTIVDKNAAALVQTKLSFASGRIELKPVDGEYWDRTSLEPLSTSHESSTTTLSSGGPCKKLCVREKTNVLLGELDVESLLHQLQDEFGPLHIEPLNMATQVKFGDTVVTFLTNENKTVVASGSDLVRARVAHLVVAQLCQF